MRLLFASLIALPAATGIAATQQTEQGRNNESIIIEESRKIGSDKELARTHLARGDAHLQRSELEQAISAYNEALLLDNSLDIVLLHRAMALGYNKQYDASINDLDEYIERNPQSSVAYTKRGLFCLQNNDIFRAVKDLERAIELDKNNAEAYDDLGVIYVQAGKLNKAITYFKAATRIDPKYAKAWHNLALANFLNEDFDRALHHVDLSLKFQPQQPQALMLKSIILEETGDLEGARRFKELAENP